MLENSIYSLEPYINNLLDGLYYEYHKADIHIIPDDNRNVFIKKVHIRYCIINNFSLSNKIKLHITFEDDTKTEELRKQNLHIKKFKVNETDLISEVESLKRIEYIEDEYHNIYSYAVAFERRLQECKRHVVDIMYEYEVANSDLTHSLKVIYPCRKINHKIFLDGDFLPKWQLSLNGFASFFSINSELEHNFKDDELTKHSAEVLFDYWTLPGTGYVVSLNKK